MSKSYFLLKPKRIKLFNEVLVIKTKACSTSLRLYRLPLTFAIKNVD